MENAQIQEPFLQSAAPYISLAAFFAIPATALVSVLGLLQIPALIYGGANPFFAAAELASLAALLTMILILRASLRLPSAPTGLYRDVLDFLALKRWHPSVIVALAGLLVLPGYWYLRTQMWVFVRLFQGGAPMLKTSDVQNGLDGLATSYQLALMGGLPLLFCLQMLARWKPKWRILPWVLIPVLFVATAIAVIILGTIAHFSRS